MKMFLMKHLFINENQFKSIISTKLKKKTLKNMLKKEKYKEGKLLKKINFEKKKKQEENKKN